MTENTALIQFGKMVRDAAAGGFAVDDTEVSREGKTIIVFGLSGGDVVAHASFPAGPWNAAERERIEQVFMAVAEKSQCKKTTTMRGMRFQKSVQLNRANIPMDIRSVSPDRRTITGIATTPTADRMGDVVEPLGCKFKNPIPLLWAHDAKAPIGKCWLMTPTAKGVEFKAEIADIQEPGALKARCDEAWQSVRAGLVESVSIGFRPLGSGEPMRGGGLRFKELEVMELSLVTIPANPDAKVLGTKMVDDQVKAKVAENEVKPLTKKRKTGGSVQLIPSSYKW